MVDANRRIAVTGASGYLGRLLVRRLALCEEVEHILAIDIRPLPGEHAPNTVFIKRDITQNITKLLIEHRRDSVAHLAFVLRPERNQERARRVNVDGGVSVLESCGAAGVRHLLYASSATVYGAHADNPPALTEDAPLRSISGFQYSEAKVEVEAALAEYGEVRPDMGICVLRMCPVLGPDADNFVAESLGRRTLFAVKCYDPSLQFLHGEDAAEIMTRCMLNEVRGTYNACPSDSIRWREVSEVSGSRLVWMPAGVIYGLTELTWRLGLQRRSPARGLDFIRYSWVISGKKMECEHGLAARYSSREAWEAFASWKGRATKATISDRNGGHTRI